MRFCCFRAPRPWLVISSQVNIHEDYVQELLHVQQQRTRTGLDDILVLEACTPMNHSARCAGDSIYSYPQILQVTGNCFCDRNLKYRYSNSNSVYILFVIQSFVSKPFDVFVGGQVLSCAKRSTSWPSDTL